MTIRTIASRWLVALLLGCAAPAFAQPDIRGGWIADVDGVRHIYIFKLSGDAFTGTQCTRCDEREDISIVRNGRVSGARLSFSLLSDRDGQWREQRFEGEIGDGEIRLRRAGGEAAPQRLVRVAAVAPAPAAVPAAAAAPPPPYVAPGSPEPQTLESMSGTWISGTGARAQILMLKALDGQLVGLICGPCDSPVTMAPIEDGSVDGTRVEFFTVHEDNGRTARPRRILTVDFGGGTLDLCIVRCEESRAQVESVHGLGLGGNLIDQTVVRELILPLLGIRRTLAAHGGRARSRHSLPVHEVRATAPELARNVSTQSEPIHDADHRAKERGR
jgi:hypothetical protein